MKLVNMVFILQCLQTQAHKLCPNGYYVSPRFEAYKATSDKIMKIFKSYTDIVEPLSLDEAYLDITHLVRPDLPNQVLLNI